MNKAILAVMFWCLTVSAHAATLIWDAANTGLLTVERGTSPTGPFTAVATVPSGTTQFVLTPAAWGHYRVTNSAGSSNTVQFSADLNSSLTARVDALEASVAALTVPAVPVPSASYLTVRDLDATHVEIVCNGLSMRTTGAGLRRVVECVR